MDFRKGTFWHQGLFLQPQHFQRFDLNQQFYRKPLYEAVSPYFWGVGNLVVASELLTARAFEVRAANLIFQDQTYIEFPGNAVISSRSFDKVWAKSDVPLRVFLGLRKLSMVSPNVTVVDSLAGVGEVNTRFASLGQAETMPDLYAQGPSAEVRTLVHVVKVFF